MPPCFLPASVDLLLEGEQPRQTLLIETLEQGLDDAFIFYRVFHLVFPLLG